MCSSDLDAFEVTFSPGLDAYTNYKQTGDAIDVTGLNVTNPGPFTLNGIRGGDEFSEYTLGRLHPATRSQNNNFEGLYLDDFIIGLAERGEAVSNAPPDTTFTTVPGTGSEIVVGPYQVEVRGGTEYGQPLPVKSPTTTNPPSPNLSVNNGIKLTQEIGRAHV